MNANDTTTIHYTGRKNKLNDELVVWEGRADWGDKGWFIGFEMDRDGVKSLHTKMFYFTKSDAMHDLTEPMFDEFKEHYVTKLKREKAEADAEAERLREGLRSIRSYVMSDKFHNDTTVQVGDIITRIQEIL